MTTDLDALVERLREARMWYEWWIVEENLWNADQNLSDTLGEAADAIEALRRERDQLAKQFVDMKTYAELCEATLGKKRDVCEVCHGVRGGVPGNENVVDGVVMCDYCHAERSARP